ncbi:MAG: hypothetical protein IJ759_06335 [Bacteroidales bacterium]|nr:hypothetical protein [Bacteroidales bacterium]
MSLYCAVALTSAFGFVACNDEDEMSKGNNRFAGFHKSSFNGIPVNVLSTDVGSRHFEMLEFDSLTDVERIYNILTSVQDEYENNLIDEALASVDTNRVKFLYNDSIGLDEYRTMRSFETSIGFSNSMRKVYEKAEGEWLAHEYDSENDISFERHPSHLFPFDDAYLALFNKDGEIKINDTIYKVEENGWFAITDGDLRTLEQYYNGEDISQDTNVIYYINENTSDCRSKSTQYRDYTDYFLGIMPMRSHLTIKFGTNWIHYAITEVTLESFMTVKNSNTGKWKEHKISGFSKCVHAETNYYDSMCNRTSIYKHNQHTSKKHKVSTKNKQWEVWGVVTPLHFKSNESIKGYYDILGSYTNGFYL